MQSLSQWAAGARVSLNSAESNARLAQAYAATFSGNGSREDAEIALVDLALFSRAYWPAAPEASDQLVRHLDGRRAVMAWLLGMIADPRILGELQVAALQEEVATKDKRK